jgi:acyl dehydratase
MSIDPSAVGFTSRRSAFAYDWKAVVLYALGIGAQKEDLGYLFEGLGPRVYPTFAVCPAMPAVRECVQRTGGNPAMIVHGGQSVRLKGAIPPSAELYTTAVIRAAHDLKKLTEVVIETNTETAGGQSVFETTWSILFRDGGFDGPRRPRSSEPEIPDDRPPDLCVELATLPEQALLYRLSGDENPLHADPNVAAAAGFTEGPILHGLCTYGFLARAVIKGACENDGARLRRLDAQFRRPVWPGDTVVTKGWKLGHGVVALSVGVKDRPGAVLSGAWAEIGPTG